MPLTRKGAILGTHAIRSLKRLPRNNLLRIRTLSNTRPTLARSRLNPFVLAAAGVVGASAYWWKSRSPPSETHTTTSPNNKEQSKWPPGTRADLPAYEVNTILRSNESYLLAPGVERIDINALASNNPIEDQHFETLLQKKGPVLLGVLDGHWDPTCGIIVRQHLPAYIETHLKTSKNISTALTSAFDTLDTDLLNLPRQAIKDFDYLDPSEIANLPLETRLHARDVIWPALTGSCAVVAYLDGSDLYVANTGDSRAVLGVRDKSGGWTAKALTDDHQPSNPKEMERLVREHPGEEKTVAFRPGGRGPLRVIGGMMPSRSFGDAKFKWPLEVQAKTDALIQSLPKRGYMWQTPRYCLTPPYMTATPEVRHHTLTPSDAFLVLATDGIFDELTNDEVVKAIASFLESESKPFSNQSHPVVDNNAATHLIRVALSQGEGPEGVSRMLTIPGYSRNYRDDMTVQVVFFKGAREGLGKRRPQHVRQMGEVDHGKRAELRPKL